MLPMSELSDIHLINRPFEVKHIIYGIIFFQYVIHLINRLFEEKHIIYSIIIFLFQFVIYNVR